MGTKSWRSTRGSLTRRTREMSAQPALSWKRTPSVTPQIQVNTQITRRRPMATEHSPRGREIPAGPLIRTRPSAPKKKKKRKGGKTLFSKKKKKKKKKKK